MPEWSRRRALQALATGAVAGLAGCGAPSSEFGGNAGRPAVAVRGGEQVSDYEVVRARRSDEKPIVTATPNEEAEPDDERDGPRYDHDHVTDAESASGYAFDPPTGGPDVGAFLRETDYETQSVFLSIVGVHPCRRRRLVRVARETNGLDIEFCTTTKPADVACAPEGREATVTAVRLPFPGDGFSGYSVGGSSSCEHEGPSFDPPETASSEERDGQ